MIATNMIATIIVEKSHSGNYHASNFHSGYYHNSDYHSGKLPLATIIRSGNSHSVDVEEHVGSLETDTTFPLNPFRIVLTVSIQFTHSYHHLQSIESLKANTDTCNIF